MSSLSLHDALSSLLAGRDGPDWMRNGIPGVGNGIDADDARADSPRPAGADGMHGGDGDGMPRSFGDGGNGPSRHVPGEGPPVHARPPAGDGTRGPQASPLAPPVPQGPPPPPGFGHGAIQHGGGVLPPHAHLGMGDALRGPNPAPLAPPVPQGLPMQAMYGLARSASVVQPPPDAGIPAHARQVASDPMRGANPQPLAPPTPQGPPHPSLEAIARELQQLPASMLRQLGEVLHRNPDALRSLPAQPEALATVLSRAAPDARAAPQAMAAEARRLTQGPEAAPPPARGQAGEAARDTRQTAQALLAEMRGVADTRQHGALDPRAAVLAQAEVRDARAAHPAEARSGWPVGADPAQAAAQRSAAGEAQAPSAALARPDAQSTTAPPGTPAAGSQAGQASQAPAGTPQAQAATTQLAQDAPQTLPARAEIPGSTVERGGQPPGMSALGGVAAGVTLAAVANPAGTTHAHAPEAAIRARGGPQEARDRKRERDGEADAHGESAGGGTADGRRQGAQPGHPAPGIASPATGAADATAAAVTSAAGNSAAVSHARSNRISGADAEQQAAADGEEAEAIAIAPGAAAAAGHTAASLAGVGRATSAEVEEAREASTRDPESLRSRRRQWLYWSLIAVTYGCLGAALATVAPDLTRLPIAPESLGAWRNGLTGIGLLTGLWAWLLARRMR